MKELLGIFFEPVILKDDGEKPPIFWTTNKMATKSYPLTSEAMIFPISLRQVEQDIYELVFLHKNLILYVSFIHDGIYFWYLKGLGII